MKIVESKIKKMKIVESKIKKNVKLTDSFHDLFHSN